MRVVFSKLQKVCADFSDGDFRDGGSAFQHMGPETAKAREPYVTVLVGLRGKSADDDELWQPTMVHTVTTDMMGAGLLVLTFVSEQAEFVGETLIDRASGAECGALIV